MKKVGAVEKCADEKMISLRNKNDRDTNKWKYIHFQNERGQ